jgi:hypothetical protein
MPVHPIVEHLLLVVHCTISPLAVWRLSLPGLGASLAAA